MGLTIDGNVINGTVLKFNLQPPETQVRRTHFWGVKGESEIRGDTGARTFIIPMWLHPFATHRDISDYITFHLNETLFMKHGTLVVNSGVDIAPIENCTFEGAFLRSNPGIIPDHAGFLGGFWIANADLRFRQNQMELA
jgi:hypothetical protein